MIGTIRAALRKLPSSLWCQWLSGKWNRKTKDQFFITEQQLLFLWTPVCEATNVLLLQLLSSSFETSSHCVSQASLELMMELRLTFNHVFHLSVQSTGITGTATPDLYSPLRRFKYRCLSYAPETSLVSAPWVQTTKQILTRISIHIYIIICLICIIITHIIYVKYTQYMYILYFTYIIYVTFKKATQIFRGDIDQIQIWKEEMDSIMEKLKRNNKDNSKCKEQRV